MGLLLILLLLLVTPILARARPRIICTEHDHAIYQRQGHTFRERMREMGGLFVSQSRYEAKVVDQIGLSPSCAACFGNAYSCGKSNCKWACSTDGEACDTCLVDHSCISDCNECTHFI